MLTICETMCIFILYNLVSANSCQLKKSLVCAFFVLIVNYSKNIMLQLQEIITYYVYE